MKINQRVCFVGAGSVSEALISGMLTSHTIDKENISVINKNNKERLLRLFEKYKVNLTHSKEEAITDAEILILAMKPNDFFQGLSEIRNYTHNKQLIISVIAGISTNTITEVLQHDGPVIRTMPNTSATIGLSATALSLGKFANEKHLELAKILLSSIGTVVKIEEDKLNAVTGLSGSGPAYIYYLVEAMELSAARLGIDRQLARDLIIQTIIGAGHMLKETQLEPSLLREKVTSPGGSTMAGLDVFDNMDLKETIYQAIKNATNRSKELGELLVNHKI